MKILATIKILGKNVIIYISPKIAYLHFADNVCGAKRPVGPHTLAVKCEDAILAKCELLHSIIIYVVNLYSAKIVRTLITFCHNSHHNYDILG